MRSSRRSSTTPPTRARRSTCSRRCRWGSSSPTAPCRRPASRSADFASYATGFDFSNRAVPGNTCQGFTYEDFPGGATANPLYTERITDGVYNLPGDTGYYGSDSNGSAVIGSAGGVGALQNIDSGCGDTGKLVYDAAALSDPEIDYSDYDTDKDGVVDFFMVVFAGCGGNGASQLGPAGCDYPGAPYDNVWPHSSSLENGYTDPVTGLPGYTTDDQLKNLEGQPLWYTDTSYTNTTDDARSDTLKVFVRVGPYNVNPETAIDFASVISHEYGHSLGLPDFYSTGTRETYGTWNLMAGPLAEHRRLRPPGARLGGAAGARQQPHRDRHEGLQGGHRPDHVAAAGRDPLHAERRRRRHGPQLRDVRRQAARPTAARPGRLRHR